MATTDQTFEPPSGEALARAHSGRKPIDIEKLLQWAYRQELPKLQFLGAGLSGRWSGFALLGTRVQHEGGGTFYGCLDVGPPDPDAGVVHEAVKELDSLKADWNEDPRVLLSDMSEGVQAEAAAALTGYRVQRSELVMRFARMGMRPDWRAEEPELRPVLAKNNRPAWFARKRVKIKAGGWMEAEVNGYDDKRCRPMEGAYRKYYFDPDPRLAVDLRADYANWHASLVWLREELLGRLEMWEPTGPVAAERPWERGEEPSARVLPALRLEAV